MRLRVSSHIQYDLAEIAEYIAQDSPMQARKMMGELRKAMAEAARNPRLYRLRPELGPEARLMPVGQYVVLFRILRDFVRVERVVHGSRDLFNLVIGDR